MAKQTINYAFKNCTISLAENTITEYGKEDIKVYTLSDILDKFSGEDKTLDITIKESSDIPASEVEGE